MKISMWILVDWLSEYNPKYSIESGECNLRSVRLFGEERDLDRSTAYLSQINSFIATAKPGVMCANRNDYIYLETSDVIEVFNKIMQAFDYYNTWENEMEQFILNKGSFQDMITASSSVFKNPIIVGDAAFRVLALDPEKKKYDKNLALFRRLQEFHQLSIKDMNLVSQEQMKRRTYKKPYLLESRDLPGTNGIIRNLFLSRQNRYGMMILKDENGFTEGETQLFDILGSFLEKWLRVHIPSHTAPAIPQLLIDLICQNYTDLDKSLDLLEGNGWKRNDSKRLILIRPCKNSGPVLSYLENYYSAEFKKCCVFLFDQDVIMLAPSTAENETFFFNELRRHLLSSVCCCGMGYLFSSFTELKAQYDAARIALKYGKHNAGAINECANYILPYITDVIKKNALCDILHPALRKLKEHDKKFETEYYHTLYLYLLNERNKAKTSRELHIHRNTLLHRLDRIEDIILLDLNEPKTRLELLISFLL